MQNNFRKFEELVFCDLWFPDSELRIPVSDSGFPFHISLSGFRVLGLPHKIHIEKNISSTLQTKVKLYKNMHSASKRIAYCKQNSCTLQTKKKL